MTNIPIGLEFVAWPLMSWSVEIGWMEEESAHDVREHGGH
jgi:hypothetical protein